MAKVCVLGGGGWAIALATVLNDNNNEVTIWSFVEQEVDMLRNERENKRSLPGVIIDDKIEITNDIKAAVTGKDIVVIATASSFVRSTSKNISKYVTEKQIIINVAKGIEDETLFTMTDIIEDEIPGVNAAVLSGPSHAEEVGKRMPTTCVIGAKNRETAEYVQNTFTNHVFRVYTSSDILGIELGGSLKNVIALAAGIADGLGFGDNTKAALITRGIKEIASLGMAMGGKIETFSGLSGIGDLIVTCASVHSRNWKAGNLIGQGRTMKEAMDEVNMVVEGVYSAKAAKKLADKYNVELPIITEVNNVLFDEKNAKDAVMDLMLRDKTMENIAVEW